MYQKLDFAIGFFIAIACLSSVLLALTFIYVSRLKPRMTPKHATMAAATEASGHTVLSELPEQPSLTRIEGRSIDVKTNLGPPNPTTLAPVPSKVTGLDDIAVVDQPKTTVAEAKDNERAASNSGDLSRESASPDPPPPTEVRTQIPSLETKGQSKVETVTPGAAPAEAVSISTSPQESTNVGLTELGAKQTANGERLGKSPGPSITVVNVSEAKGTMADEPKADQPRDVKQDAFSDLFTEDTVETEATKLGKDLTDIDAGDILEMTQNLANQLKVRRPATK